MLLRPSMLAALAAIVCACSSNEPTTAAADAGGTSVADASNASPGDDASAAPIADGGDAGGKTTIGTLTSKGTKTVHPDLSSHGSWTCGGVCAEAKGTCLVGGNGAGYEYRKYNDGHGTFDSRVSSCTESIAYFSGNTTLTALDCYCDGMDIAPYVTIAKGEAITSCNEVCASWSLVCDPSGVSKSYAANGNTTKLACSDTPAASTDHYVCACKKP